MKIGILGGSFDPIHHGHIYMANQAFKEYSLDEVWLMPTGHSANKDESRMTAAFHRKTMCEIAVNKYPHLLVSTLEMDSRDRSYTYRTMQKLTSQYPMHEFYFIMGADSLDYFLKWKYPEIISALCVLLVVNRNTFEESDLQEKIFEIQHHFSADIRIVHCPKYEISSSEIRCRLKNNKNISEFLDENVLSYIMENQVY